MCIRDSSDGSANQAFSLNQSILQSPEVWTRLSESRFNGATVRKEGESPDSTWIKWTGVRNFHQSGREDLHFTVNLRDGTFTFGDGVHGLIPPAEAEIRIQYSVTEGSKGNVGSNTITEPQKNWPFVQNVQNFLPAEGGSGPED